MDRYAHRRQSHVAPPDTLHRAADLVRSVPAIHQAVSYQHMLPSLDGPTHASMARGGAFWLRRVLDRQAGFLEG